GFVESVDFHRDSAVRGVEVRDVGPSARTFGFYSADYEFLAPSGWSGEVLHRRMTGMLGPGAVLCAQPGDVVAARKVFTAGARCSLVVEEPTLLEFLDEHGWRAGSIEVVSRARMSPALDASLAAVFRRFRAKCSALELEVALVEFLGRAVPELFGRTSVAATRAAASSAPKAAERMREVLEDDPAETIDLAALAREVGLSRFGALRAFKRQFGLPPHAYQLSMRLGLARRSLRHGHKPAEVAAEYGFVDQSHFTHHFKRLIGIAPAEYARIGAAHRAVAGQSRMNRGVSPE
ncbi:MAG TPA: AraC family transcriptional regulator, partial [Polyangiaceae bacterium]